jgi:hypothetical protein
VPRYASFLVSPTFTICYTSGKHEHTGCGTIFPLGKWFFRQKNGFSAWKMVFPLEKWRSSVRIHFSAGKTT